MAKLTRRHRNVLAHLAQANRLQDRCDLPNGNGHTTGPSCASNATLDGLQDDHLIELTRYGERWGYRITDAGRRALSEQSNG